MVLLVFISSKVGIVSPPLYMDRNGGPDGELSFQGHNDKVMDLRHKPLPTGTSVSFVTS